MRPPASRGASIVMVQAAEDRDRAHRPLADPCGTRRRRGHRLAEALVRPRVVEVGDILAEHAREVALAEDEQVVQALTAHAAQEPLAGRIRARRAIGCAQDLTAAGRRDTRESGPELAVVVTDQVARALAERGGLAQLLGDSGIGRVARRTHMDDPPRGQLDDEEGEERSEGEVRHGQEVAGPDARGVVA